jgi:hypothetical protein
MNLLNILNNLLDRVALALIPLEDMYVDMSEEDM